MPRPSPPAGGIEACRSALAELPQAGRFPACRAAMERLSAARRTGWEAVRLLRQAVVMATQDARRRSGGVLVANLNRLRRALAEAEAAAQDARTALAGLIEPIWVERYLAERIEPLREELAGLEVRVRQLDPAGYAASRE